MEIKVPQLGESITEATVARWFKAIGDAVERDEPICELETDKVTLEVPAAESGTLTEIVAAEGAEVAVGAVLGIIGEGNGAVAVKAPAPVAEKPPAPATKADPPAAAKTAEALSPSVRRLVDEHGLDAARIAGSGKGGRLTKADVLAHMKTAEPPAPAEPAPAAPATAGPARGEERVRMTRLRRRIAERLKEAQNTAAILTTFNEVDMTEVLAARARYRDRFEKKHGVRLGFMSFFAKACIAALKEIPSVNAMIDGDEIVYRHYVDLGVAVGTDQGLVVPVLRDADGKSFAETEKEIGRLGRAARDGSLGIEALTGGTFTITNGGVYGSLLSTPILNPPQSGILGMHKIEKRPVAIGDEVEVRPMMYLALSYDHRIVDGAEAVTFLVRVKECIEDPARILFDV